MRFQFPFECVQKQTVVTHFGSLVVCRIGLENKPGIEQVQALAGISRSALCYHTNETHAPFANPPNSAQLDGTPTIPQVTSGSVQ